VTKWPKARYFESKLTQPYTGALLLVSQHILACNFFLVHFVILTFLESASKEDFLYPSWPYSIKKISWPVLDPNHNITKKLKIWGPPVSKSILFALLYLNGWAYPHEMKQMNPTYGDDSVCVGTVHNRVGTEKISYSGTWLCPFAPKQCR
jgi:hypothetical protein